MSFTTTTFTMKSTLIAIILVGSLLVCSFDQTEAAKAGKIPANHKNVAHCDIICARGGPVVPCCSASRAYNDGYCRNRKAYCYKRLGSG